MVATFGLSTAATPLTNVSFVTRVLHFHSLAGWRIIPVMKNANLIRPPEPPALPGHPAKMDGSDPKPVFHLRMNLRRSLRTKA